MALWTFDEQQMIKSVSLNNKEKFSQLQSEVELNDLQLYLGSEFYQELLRNPNNYATLLNGGTYTYNGVTYSFRGLKVVCAFLFYARYVRQSYINDTFSGFTVHVGDGFQRLSSDELRNQEQRYKEIAGTAWDECLSYLRTLNLDYFPQKSKRKFKFTSL